MIFCGGWGGCGLQSHFHVQPNYSVEVVLLVVLCWRWGCDNRSNGSKTRAFLSVTSELNVEGGGSYNGDTCQQKGLGVIFAKKKCAIEKIIDTKFILNTVISRSKEKLLLWTQGWPLIVAHFIWEYFRISKNDKEQSQL